MKNDIWVFRKLVKHGLYAFFELAAIFGAGHHTCHVESDHTFVEQYARDFALHDAEREPFDYRGLSYARLSDQYGIVLLSA